MGGSDHAVYILDAASCKLKRTLFKAGGHCEWVSCLAHTPEGHVISGALPQSVMVAWLLSVVRVCSATQPCHPPETDKLSLCVLEL